MSSKQLINEGVGDVPLNVGDAPLNDNSDEAMSKSSHDKEFPETSSKSNSWGGETRRRFPSPQDEAHVP